MVAMGKFVCDQELSDKFYVFKDRADAGRRLGEKLKELDIRGDIVFAIPAGGVPVGYEVAKALNTKLDVLICRKVLIPWNREAGFGSVAPDGTVFINEVFARELGLTDEDVRAAVDEQLYEIKRRIRIFRAGKDYERLDGVTAIVVDDGIAAGYTMFSAVRFLKRLGTKEVIIAVPTCHVESAMRLKRDVDLLVCLNARRGLVYAVADAYQEWHDLSDEEVLRILKRAQEEGILAF